MSKRDKRRAKRQRHYGETGGGWQRYRPPARDEVTRETLDTVGDPLPEPPPPRPRRRGLWLGAAGVAIVAAAGAGVVTVVASGGVGEARPTPYPAEKRYEPILTEAAADAIATALMEETGSTQVLDVRVRGVDEVWLVVPPAPGGDLADQWTWDGRILAKVAAEKPGDRVPFGWEQIEPAVLVDLDEEARSRSDGDISDSRVHVERPVDDDSHWFFVKVDEVDHGGVALWADLDGTVESDLIHEDWRDD